MCLVSGAPTLSWGVSSFLGLVWGLPGTVAPELGQLSRELKEIARIAFTAAPGLAFPRQDEKSLSELRSLA